MAPLAFEESITQGLLRTTGGLPLPLERTDADAKIAGPIAEVEVRQIFLNPLDRAIEAVYLFPLPHAAAVHSLSFTIRDRVVRGVVKEREEARRDYEKARAEGRAATLLEQDRPSLFSMSIANIAPGERITVTLGYQEKLAFDDGEYRFVFPMVAAERHEAMAPDAAAPGAAASGAAAPGAAAPGAAAKLPPGPPRRARARAPAERAADIGVRVTVRAGVDVDPPRCTSHRVTTARFGPGSFTVSLVEEGRIPNRDFVLSYRPSGRRRPRSGSRSSASRSSTGSRARTPPSSLSTARRPTRTPSAIPCASTCPRPRRRGSSAAPLRPSASCPRRASRTTTTTTSGRRSEAGA